MSDKALDGVKVLELSQMVSGPYCGKLLADLGAEVIKIEKPRVGDEARKRGPFLNNQPHPERSGLFLYLNTNKLGITLDVSSPTGKELFRKLVMGTDILIEDNSPGTMDEMGLGYEDLQSINKGLIMTSITPFGQTGPYKHYKGYNLNVCHGSGEGYIIGANCEDPMRLPPVRSGRYVTDYEAGIGGASATLIALYWRGTSGLGQHIDLSKQEWGIGMTLRSFTRYICDGKFENRVTANYPVFGLMPCKDGHVHLQAFFHWKQIVEAMGNPEWTRDEKYQTEFGRTSNGREITRRTTEWLKELTRDEVFRITEDKHIPCGPVNNAKDLVNAEYLNERGFFVDIEHPETGKLKYCSAPYKFSETPWSVTRPACLLGQHNQEIYTSRLGLSEQDLVRLRGAGII